MCVRTKRSTIVFYILKMGLFLFSFFAFLRVCVYIFHVCYSSASVFLSFLWETSMVSLRRSNLAPWCYLVVVCVLSDAIVLSPLMGSRIHLQPFLVNHV